jgi:NADH-quinone oxidoreductase subunit N
MSCSDFLAMFPLLIVGYSAVALMLVTAFRPKHSAAFILTLAGLAAGMVSIVVAFPYAPRTVTAFIRIDAFSLFFTALSIASAFVIALFCRDYLDAHETRTHAFYVLLLFAVTGMAAVASSIHLIAFFLGVEILSVSLYGLIGYTRDHRESQEGAVKYLVMAAASSAFLLFGIALIYADSGTMEIDKLSALAAGGNLSTLSLFGTALILVVFGFKLALAPFHTWSPDVYQGAPSPVTALIATGSKGAVLAFLVRLTLMADPLQSRPIFAALTALSIATMFAGNILALMQTNLKRMLAYSSIAHLGYLLIPVIAGGMLGAASIGFYLAAYFATTIAAFGVIAVLSSSRSHGDAEELQEYRGLAYRHPVLTAVFSLALISLTGIPPTAGFIAKFYIFSAAIHSGLWTLVIIGVINSGISAFYYLRVVAAMYGTPGDEIPAHPNPKPLPAFALGICTSIILIFGIYPEPLIKLAETAMKLTGLR